MNGKIWIATGLLALTLAPSAFAFDRGDRVAERFERRGDHAEAHYDRLAARARAQGKERLADRFERKGDLAERHFDRLADRYEDRYDRRDDRRDRRWDRRDDRWDRRYDRWDDRRGVRVYRWPGW